QRGRARRKHHYRNANLSGAWLYALGTPLVMVLVWVIMYMSASLSWFGYVCVCVCVCVCVVFGVVLYVCMHIYCIEGTLYVRVCVCVFVCVYAYIFFLFLPQNMNVSESKQF